MEQKVPGSQLKESIPGYHGVNTGFLHKVGTKIKASVTCDSMAPDAIAGSLGDVPSTVTSI